MRERSRRITVNVPERDRLIESNEVARCGPVLAEIRRGLRSHAERSRGLLLRAPIAKQNRRQQICVNGTWQNTTNVSCYGSCRDPYGCEEW